MSGNGQEGSYDIRKLRVSEKRNALILQQEELARQQQREAADPAQMQEEPSEEVGHVEPARTETTNAVTMSSRTNGKNPKSVGRGRGRPSKRKNKKLPIVQTIEEASIGDELLPTESFSAPVVNQLVIGTASREEVATGGQEDPRGSSPGE